MIYVGKYRKYMRMSLLTICHENLYIFLRGIFMWESLVSVGQLWGREAAGFYLLCMGEFVEDIGGEGMKAVIEMCDGDEELIG